MLNISSSDQYCFSTFFVSFNLLTLIILKYVPEKLGVVDELEKGGKWKKFYRQMW